MSGGTRKPLEPVLFIDRNAWSRALGEALNAAGISFVAHYQRFAPAAPDTEWLAVAGAEGWLVLTRDQNIRRRPNELAAVAAAGVCMFVLGQGNLSAPRLRESWSTPGRGCSRRHAAHAARPSSR